MGTRRSEGLEEIESIINECVTDDMEEEENNISEESEDEKDDEATARKHENTQDMESKEQSYKRLLHLLKCSKFYTEFMLQRLNHTRESHITKKSLQSSSTMNEKSKDSEGLQTLQSSKISVKNKSTEKSKSHALRERNTNTQPIVVLEDIQPFLKKIKTKRKRVDDLCDITTFMDQQTLETIEKRIKLKDKSDVSDSGCSKSVTETIEKRIKLKDKSDVSDSGCSKSVTEGTYKTAFGHIVSKGQPLLFEGGILRDYQLEGLEWLKCLYENGMSGILADEMGLGKTLQTIALICHLIEKMCRGPYLILAPLSTLPNWCIEFERFAPQIPVLLYHGDFEKRKQLQKQMEQTKKLCGVKVFPVILTSYELPLRDSTLFRSVAWKYIIVDEGHRLKNHESLLSRELRKYRPTNKLLLTGTPLQNNLTELWSLLNFILPEFFHDLELFETLFDVSDLQGDQANSKIIEQEQQTKILSTMHQILAPFLLRRLKVDVNLNIPQKKELLVYAPMTPIQLLLYRSTVDRSIDALLGGRKTNEVALDSDGRAIKRKAFLKKRNYTLDSDEDFDWSSYIKEEEVEIVDPKNRDYIIRLKMTNVSMMLRKIVNHPYLVQMPLIPGQKVNELKVDEELVNKSGKLLVLDAMLIKLKERGHKVLIFSTFCTVLDLIEEYLLMRETYRYCRIDGSTHIDERKEYISTFNSDPDVFAFLLSTRAGGLGINLTGADTVILFDSDWNPQADLQAQDRCHRIGQTKPVVVYRFVTSGTIDEDIVSRAAAKRKLEKMIILKGKFKLNRNSQMTLMTLQELKELLESHDHQEVIHSNGYVFSDEELEELLDRSDLMGGGSRKKSRGEDTLSSTTKRVFKVL